MNERDDMVFPPILWWSASLSVGDGLDWEPGIAAGVIEETEAGTFYASHEGGWAILRELPADAVRLVCDPSLASPAGVSRPSDPDSLEVTR